MEEKPYQFVIPADSVTVRIMAADLREAVCILETARDEDNLCSKVVKIDFNGGPAELVEDVI